jgi:hypothetical protein
MGLDMYLKATRYVNGWDNQTIEQKRDFAVILKKIGLTGADVEPNSPSMDISVTVGYWRKANAIHSWFVNNVQGGRDECQTAYVSREQLIQLKTVCLEVLIDNDKADELLAPVSGFFFGSTDIDQWYLNDLKHTVEIINKCLSDKFKDFSFQYRSSW